MKNKDANSQLHQIENEGNSRCDSNVLTFDDRALQYQGKGPQKYHAFLLFDDSDINFATQILDELAERGLKVK